MIEDTNILGFGGFTPAGYAKAIPRALARRAEAEYAAGGPFKVRVLTGASTGASVNSEPAKAEAITFAGTVPRQSNIA